MNHYFLYLFSKFSRLAFVSCSICLVATISNAQQTAISDKADTDQAKRPKISDDTWKLQAETVATKLGLPKDKGDRLVQTYVATREARKLALKELSKSDDETTDQSDKREQVNARQRDQLKSAISEYLDPVQIDEALLSLGSFNPRWDRYVSQINEFQLDEQNKQDALQLTYDYIVEYGKARNAAAEAGIRFSSVTAHTLKGTLDASLAKLLSDEQLSKWNEVTAFRGGGGKRSSPGEGKRQGKQGGRKS